MSDAYISTLLLNATLAFRSAILRLYNYCYENINEFGVKSGCEFSNYVRNVFLLSFFHLFTVGELCFRTNRPE